MSERFMITPNKTISHANCKGFTLVELMLAMAITGIVLLAAFKIYQVQQKHYTAQLEVTEMHQNIRAALNIMTRDIRMAGYDAVGSSEAEIVNAKPDLFHFTVDLNEDGDVADAGENIAYDLYDSDGKPNLGRTSSPNTIEVIENPPGHWEVDGSGGNPSHRPAAENIEHLEFYYLDEDGDPTTDENDIRTVKITIIARTDIPDPDFSYTSPFTLASGATWTPADSHYRRKMQIMTVECRNVGL